MMYAENYVRTYRGFDLVLLPFNGGHGYEWHDGHGRVVLSGWLPVGFSQARAEAEARMIAALGGEK